MNTAELKRELIRQIESIDDPYFLNAIKTILDYNKKEPVIELAPEQINELLKASEEGKSGHYTSQVEMDKKVNQWLNEE
ncbi:MAG: hypothetical protein KKA81_04070 [Bacteroidetes bacterium]|nr:hypothetical protein [Bacteroidota bacterium]